MSGAAFGPDRSWLAVRSNDPELVRHGFGFERVDKASLADGLAAVSSGRAFVTPPVGVWTLVVVDRLRVDELARLSSRVSARAGEVQAFVCQGGARHFAWLLARDGKLVRMCEIARGRLRRDVGERLPGEPEPAASVDESAVLTLAERWSVDPSALAFKSELGHGAIGHFPVASRRRWHVRLPGLVGGAGLVLIELAGVLAFGRLFAHVEKWWLGAAFGLLIAAYAWLSRPGAKLERAALLLGIAIALGALIGGAFPANALD